MAFFDDLSKKISQAGQTAVQKTKEMTEIARINGLISDEEKKMTNNYYQIGKLYVAMHQHDFESDFAGMITAISESETKIRDFKQQIQDIKGVIRCEKCGAEVTKGIAFCSACGAAMPQIETTTVSDHNKCANCGAAVAKGMRFCTSCGKPMATVVVNSAVQSVTEPVKKTCANCGTVLEDNVAFCTECGTKV